MRPVAIFRHSPTEGPGYFAIFLEAHRIPWTLIPLDDGAVVPKDASAYSGLCFMGGPMSVNDDLPWIDPVLALIRAADADGLPVIGHCLGGQLIARALGARVTKNAQPEIGWGQVDCADAAVARSWLGELAGTRRGVFQWHGETFSLPEGATRIAASAYCANQMFVRQKHLAMQCHVEMLPEMIGCWTTQWRQQALAAGHHASVQAPETMMQEIPERLPALRQLADQLYTKWIEGLVA